MKTLRKSQRATQRRLRFERNKRQRLQDARIYRRDLKRNGPQTLRYILRGKQPVPCPRLLRWARWFEQERYSIGRDYVGEALVSTVFLGLDHSFGFHGPPVLFETMVFEGEHDSHQQRYSTWDEARAGHIRMTDLIRSQA